MKRLTFQEENGKFGVVGMNASNQDQKLYACVEKLKDYENLNLDPNEIELLKSENERLIKQFDEINSRYCKEADRNIELHQELNDRKKEIRKMLSPSYVSKLCKVERIRICEKIRFFTKENAFSTPSLVGNDCILENVVNADELYEFLDQIERGNL